MELMFIVMCGLIPISMIFMVFHIILNLFFTLIGSLNLLPLLARKVLENCPTRNNGTCPRTSISRKKTLWFHFWFLHDPVQFCQLWVQDYTAEPETEPNSRKRKLHHYNDQFSCVIADINSDFKYGSYSTLSIIWKVLQEINITIISFK